LIVFGAALMGLGCAGLLGLGAGAAYVALAGQLTALGFGLGLIVPAMTSALLGSTARERSGVASGTLNTARQTGSVLGVALFGALISGPGSVVPGWHVALWISIGLFLMIMALSAGIGGSGRVSATSTPDRRNTRAVHGDQ
jgi:DHA2 family methylenomycin A resistance protein-like MFS transporter